MTTEQMDWLDDERAGRHRRAETSVVNGGWNPPLTREEAVLLRNGYTRDQIVMRREMVTQLETSQEPVKVDVVLNQVLGVADPDTAEEARLIIDEAGGGLVLSLDQWRQVAHLVHLALVAGRAGR